MWLGGERLISRGGNILRGKMSTQTGGEKVAETHGYDGESIRTIEELRRAVKVELDALRNEIAGNPKINPDAFVVVMDLSVKLESALYGQNANWGGLNPFIAAIDFAQDIIALGYVAKDKEIVRVAKDINTLLTHYNVGCTKLVVER